MRWGGVGWPAKMGHTWWTSWFPSSLVGRCCSTVVEKNESASREAGPKNCWVISCTQNQEMWIKRWYTFHECIYPRTNNFPPTLHVHQISPGKKNGSSLATQLTSLQQPNCNKKNVGYPLILRIRKGSLQLSSSCRIGKYIIPGSP